MVLGFGDLTKGMTRILGHFVILDECECAMLRLQIMLKASRCIFAGDEKYVAISQSGNGIFSTLIILWSFVKGRGFP